MVRVHGTDTSPRRWRPEVAGRSRSSGDGAGAWQAAAPGLLDWRWPRVGSLNGIQQPTQSNRRDLPIATGERLLARGTTTASEPAWLWSALNTRCGSDILS